MYFFLGMGALSACLPVGQKRVPNPTIDDCEPPYGYWELNSKLSAL